MRDARSVSPLSFWGSTYTSRMCTSYRATHTYIVLYTYVTRTRHSMSARSNTIQPKTNTTHVWQINARHNIQQLLPIFVMRVRFFCVPRAIVVPRNRSRACSIVPNLCVYRKHRAPLSNGVSYRVVVVVVWNSRKTRILANAHPFVYVFVFAGAQTNRHTYRTGDHVANIQTDEMRSGGSPVVLCVFSDVLYPVVQHIPWCCLLCSGNCAGGLHGR